MIFYYNTSVAAMTTVNSVNKYVGNGNAANSLIANPAQCLLINGATTDITVKLQAAAVPTPTNQVVTILSGDWVDIATYTTNTYTTFPSLNGLWVRFVVHNNTGSPAPITVSLG